VGSVLIAAVVVCLIMLLKLGRVIEYVFPLDVGFALFYHVQVLNLQTLAKQKALGYVP